MKSRLYSISLQTSIWIVGNWKVLTRSLKISVFINWRTGFLFARFVISFNYFVCVYRGRWQVVISFGFRLSSLFLLYSFWFCSSVFYFCFLFFFLSLYTFFLNSLCIEPLPIWSLHCSHNQANTLAEVLWQKGERRFDISELWIILKSFWTEKKVYFPIDVLEEQFLHQD